MFSQHPHVVVWPADSRAGSQPMMKACLFRYGSPIPAFPCVNSTGPLWPPATARGFQRHQTLNQNAPDCCSDLKDCGQQGLWLAGQPVGFGMASSVSSPTPGLLELSSVPSWFFELFSYSDRQMFLAISCPALEGNTSLFSKTFLIFHTSSTHLRIHTCIFHDTFSTLTKLQAPINISEASGQL
jgi:hypothetical protein